MSDPIPVNPCVLVGTDLLILDLDGTCRECTVPGQVCPNKRGEQRILPGVRKRLLAHHEMGCAIHFATNQNGVARGYFTEEDLIDTLEEFVEILDLPQLHLSINHHFMWAPKSDLRKKPSPAMLFGAMERAGCWDDERILYVGDWTSDRDAAERARVRFMWAWEWNPEGPVNEDLLKLL